MPYLRLLTNAVLAGALGAAMLLQLLLLLNPELPLRVSVVAALGWRLLVTAGAAMALVFSLASLLRYRVTRRSPGWLSLRLLAWMSTLVVGLAALLARLNLSTFEPSLTEAAARRFGAAAVTLVVTTAVLLLIALVHYSFGRRGSRVGGTLYAIAIIAAIGLPLVARGPGERAPSLASHVRSVDASMREPPAGRVWMVLLDGASLDYVSPAAAQGRLPHLGRLIDAGASVTLFSIEPRQPEPIWASVASGRYPPGSGVASAQRYQAGHDLWLDLLPRYVFAHVLTEGGLLRPEPRGVQSLRAAPMWTVLEASGVPVGVCAWPLAVSSPTTSGFICTDDHRAPRDPIARDRATRAAFERALGDCDVQVGAVRYAALSSVGSEGLAQPLGRGRRLRADALYDFLDEEIGRVIDRLAPGDLLMVISGYRLEPASPIARLRGRLLDAAGLAAEANRSDGFLLAFGRHVAPGRKSVGAIVDVLPTVLYYLGLPVARDMDGFARIDLFDSALTAERPVSFIRSYQ